MFLLTNQTQTHLDEDLTSLNLRFGCFKSTSPWTWAEDIPAPNKVTDKSWRGECSQQRHFVCSFVLGITVNIKYNICHKINASVLFNLFGEMLCCVALTLPWSLCHNFLLPICKQRKSKLHRNTLWMLMNYKTTLKQGKVSWHSLMLILIALEEIIFLTEELCSHYAHTLQIIECIKT